MLRLSEDCKNHTANLMQKDLCGFIFDSDDSRAEVITLVREVVVEHNGKVSVRGVELSYI